MKKLILIILILIIFLLTSYAMVLIRIRNRSVLDTKIKSDLILVLGGHVYSGESCVGPICKKINFVPNRRYNPCVLSRVEHAVSLYKDGYAPKILMSGGTDKEDGANEAETMKKMAIELGVPESAILIENKSTSTYENFSLSQKIISETDLKSVIVVTEPYHNARSEMVAKKLNYNYTLSPAIESVCWNKENFLANWNFVKKESLAFILYKVINKI